MKVFILIILVLFGFQAESQVTEQLLQELNKELYPINSKEDNDFLYGTNDFNNTIVEIRARKNQPNKKKVIELCKKIRSVAALSDTALLIDILGKYSNLFEKEWEKDIRIRNEYGHSFNQVLVELLKNYYFLKIKDQFESESDQYFFLKFRYHKFACESLRKYNSQFLTNIDTLDNGCHFTDALYVSPFISFFEHNASGASLVNSELILENISNYEPYIMEDLLNLDLIIDYCDFKCNSGVIQHSFLYLIIPFYYIERSSPTFNTFLFKNYNRIKNAVCVPCLLGNSGVAEGLEIFKNEFLNDSNAFNVMLDFSLSTKGKTMLIPLVLSQLDEPNLTNKRKFEYIKYLGLQKDEKISQKLHTLFNKVDNVEIKNAIINSLWNIYVLLKKDHSEFNRLEKMKTIVNPDYFPKYLNEK